MTFGKWIDNKYGESGYTLDKIAYKAKIVNPSSIYGWMNGSTSILLKTLVRVVQVFGCELVIRDKKTKVCTVIEDGGIYG